VGWVASLGCPLRLSQRPPRVRPSELETESSFEDFRRADNIAADPQTCERENEAIARDGRLDAALRDVADWAGRDLLDVGAGFWLPRYVASASSVTGVEPDPQLLQAARDRVRAIDNADVMAGSAEHLLVADASMDIVHARFAYFFGRGADAGLAEVRRVLRPGGTFIAIDNDWGWGEFSELLQLATTGNAAIDPDDTDTWWREQAAERINVRAGWQATSSEELETILRLEFPDEVVDEFLVTRKPSDRLSYGVALFVVHR
jgi:SAM-dependent methyltransferase